MINEKINKIDELLNDDKILEEYINNTYDSTFNTPPGLENRILNGVYSKNIKKTNIFFLRKQQWTSLESAVKW